MTLYNIYINNLKIMNNHIIKINGQSVVIYQSSRKLIWLSLPELTPVCRYYTKSNFVQAMDSGSLVVIDKNSVSFLTINLAPLSLGLFKQDFLDWEPIGGVCLSSVLILFDKHKINFYERSQNLKKTWTIQVMQQIKQLKSSPQEKVIGMTVKQKKNTIFLWNLHDISNKPLQQIAVSQSIIKWQFYAKDMIAILTHKQFQVYFPKDDHYNLQYFVQVAHVAIDFCFLNRPKTSQHSGRRIVYPVCILCPQGKVYLYEMYDMDKRIKNSMASIIATLQIEQNSRYIICGYENQDQQIILCAQTNSGKPISMILNSHFLQKQKYQYLPELNTQNTNLIQYCKQIICTQDYKINDKKQKIKNYRLYRIVDKEQHQFIEEYQSDSFGIIGGYNFFCFNTNRLDVYAKSDNFDIRKKVVIEDVKVPSNLYLLEQRQNVVYFISGIKLYRLDITKKTFKNMGFTIKNDRFKLVQVRNQTRSILYKSNDEYLLIQYQTPKNPANESQKILIKTIKSSSNSMISLRNNRWVQKLPNKIVVGQANKKLQEFDLAKFFKNLTQENNLLEYQIYWTTHDGLILIIKNYIFLLQIVESSDGYAINPIKKSLNYLHCRFNPDSDGVQVLDARNIVIRQGNRILKLGTKLPNFVSEDPFSLPDTLLRRQLLMRKMYPPHHPKIVQYLIQLGHFNILEKMFINIYEWIQENGTMSNLFQKIGAQFLISNAEKSQQIKLPIVTKQQLDEQPILKKLCQRILQNPSTLNLEQNGGLILQSQIQAMIFKQQNSRSLDSYSQVIITQFKTYETKNESFKTMHIAYMLHSINKEQAVNILKGDKKQIDWEWVKRYSIVLWYDSKNQIKAWAEEIGGNLFKINKEPFDSLFWYTIAGKKAVLVQLFKKYTFNSAEHDAIFKFLQRDFTDPKNQNAAVKNAYVLIDKKRYMHALAFFIYGQKIDEAISLCLNKLKDLNLAFLICSLVDDQINRNKILDILMNQGDTWAKHIAYFYKNQHIDSFNCLFQEQNLELYANWNYQPKLTTFHPALKQFSEMIQKSVPVKRQLQQQQMSKNKIDSNDIFESFFGTEAETKVQQIQIQQKHLTPNYQWIKKQSIAYFIRNSCSILALMIDPFQHRARRAYDLCSFMLTQQVNSTVLQLIYQMQDYLSIIDTKINSKEEINSTVQQINLKFKQVLDHFLLSSLVKLQKSKIGELMHYGFLGQKILQRLSKSQKKLQQNTHRNLQIFIEISKILLILQLQIYEKMEEFATQFTNFLFQPQKPKQEIKKQQFWQLVKNYYDKIAEIKKNKKQNLYDMFQQSLYKYAYKKPENCPQNTLYKLDIQKCVPIFLKKMFLQNIIGVLSEKFQNNGYNQIISPLTKIKRKLQSVLVRWGEQKSLQQLQRQVKQMFNQGVVSKLKLTFLPAYLNDKFQYFCRALMQIKSKIKKPYIQKDKSKTIADKIEKNQVIQIFRNKQEAIKAFAINKNQGLGMQLAILTKRAVKKVQICDSLINRNRSQDGASLIHQDNFYNMDSQFDYRSMFNNTHLPLIQKFLNGVVQNRKQYDGLGIIKGSTKRTTPQYLKNLDPIPFVQNSQINCIQCHHFLPIYMLGGKSVIELCSFATNSNYNRIKCTGLGDIMKIRSYEQRVTVLDKDGNLGSYSFDSKITGNSVFSLKKAGVIDFCLMTPTTYGFCTSNSIQVIDSLLHPKRQVVFKTQTNQAPIAVDYFNQTKLAICRRGDVNIYDTRMDILSQSRDLGGKAKCMTSNYKNRILVGKMDNKVRLLNMSGPGSEDDYDIKCISNIRGNQNLSQKYSIDDIEIMGKFAVTLNSEGIISMFSIQ